jgi:hypothetical protein
VGVGGGEVEGKGAGAAGDGSVLPRIKSSRVCELHTCVLEGVVLMKVGVRQGPRRHGWE